eukprot:TRINITY_DN17431_c0_g1_i1.p1 TRINITY_DN17431_c0_g1~~TRINITY_DN17431_c0_g1_i1.p1  ORF type:complete len:573 (-),score=185.69 TRINITY_DN17431_c0_g1_i1:72-1790(-)
MAEDEGHKINVEKTYNQILAKREAKISKDALVERRACQLTKHFLRSRERDAKAQLEEQAKQSKVSYERSMQKSRDAAEAEAAAQIMVREERALISEHMREMGRQRKEAEIKAKEEKDEREKWKYARVLYERFQAEERAKTLQDREREMTEKLEERAQKLEERLKEAKDLEEKKLQEKTEKLVAEQNKAAERKKKQLLEARQAVKTETERVDRKLREAEQRRNDQMKKMADAHRQQMEVVNQKVAECEERREKLREERHQRILEKAEQYQLRTRHSRLATEEEAEDESGDGSRDGHDGPNKAGKLKRGMLPKHAQTQMDLQQTGTSENKDKDKEKKQEDGHHPASPRISYDSKELVDANNRAQKEYLRKVTDQQQANYVAFSRKKFKTLADDALIKQDSIDDPCFVRMRSLHSTYIEKSKGKGSSDPPGDAKQPGAAASPPQPASARTRREVKEKSRLCGFCEREFPPESLVGSAKRRILERLKSRNPGDSRRLLDPLGPAGAIQGSGPPGQAAPVAAGLPDRPAEAAAGGAGASQAGLDHKPSPGLGLYDYEVPLCASCNHKVTVGGLLSAR